MFIWWSKLLGDANFLGTVSGERNKADNICVNTFLAMMPAKNEVFWVYLARFTRAVYPPAAQLSQQPMQGAQGRAMGRDCRD